jgi:hypothetical protein
MSPVRATHTTADRSARALSNLSIPWTEVLRLARELEIEKQRRIKAEKEARTLRLAALKWHQHMEPPGAKNVWHP